MHRNMGVRIVEVSDAKRLQGLLESNRGWLEQWEATSPGYRSFAPSVSQVRSSIRSLRKGWRDGYGVPFVIFYDGEVVGQMSVSEIGWGALRSGQIGYWISEEYAGLGITPKAVALVIDYMLEYGGLHRIEICLRPENEPSRRVVEKLGLRYEGRREKYIYIDGGWRDHDCYAIVEEERGLGVMARLTAQN